MIEPNPPPSRSCRYSSNRRLSSSLVAPPEKITIRLPSKADWTTWRTRSASVLMGTPALSYDFLASACSRCALGGFTLMICAPSCAAIWAAYATTSSAVSPSLLRLDPRGYDQTTDARPADRASPIISRHCWYRACALAEPG